MLLKTKYGEYDVELKWERYAINDRPCMKFIDKKDGEVIVISTVNLPHVRLDANQVLIKDYSENEGILQALIDLKIVEDTGIKVSAGYVEVSVCKLLVKPNV